jgi:plastocyanin
MRRSTVWVTAAALGGLTVGCGDDGRFVNAPPPSSIVGDPLSHPRPVATVAPTGGVAVVQAIDNTFRAPTLEIAPGTEVRWENRGRNEHDVMPVEGDRWGVDPEEFRPGETYSHVFTAPGEYAYFCTLHGTETAGMVGTVVVTDG